jgi:hypothetical protein
VLGSEAESLRRALQEIQRADEQVRSEMRAQAGEDSEQADSFSGDREGASEGGSQRNRESQSDRESQRDRGLREDRGSAREVGAPGEVESASGSMMERLRVEQEGGRGSGVGNAAPMMGEDYAQWSDRLRDIEELVRDPEWKAEAARIREAAREFRMEYKRHAKEPQWDLVKELISDPLKDLQKKVREELLRKTAKQNELVPLDRDPVPERFQRKLDRYFEELGTGERK